VEREKPKPYHHGDLRYALIQAGLEVLSEDGGASLDLRKVARRAGVSHAAPYRHFADRESLAYVQFARENPWLMREMFSGLTIDRNSFAGLHDASKTVYSLYVDVVKRGQSQGTVVRGDPTALAGVLWAMLHGVAMLTIEHQLGPYAEGEDGAANVTRFSIQMLYEGLGRHATDAQ
jgi:hypothetical protein